MHEAGVQRSVMLGRILRAYNAQSLMRIMTLSLTVGTAVGPDNVKAATCI